MKNKGADLYEILAARQAKQGVKSSPSLPAPANLPSLRPPPVGQNSMDGISGKSKAAQSNSISFSLESAFIIFIAVLLFIGCAYVLGHSKGVIDGREGLSRHLIEARDSVSLVEQDGNVKIRESVTFDKNRYTVKLSSTRTRDKTSLERLRLERDYVISRQIDGINDGLDAFIFDSGEVYILSVGSFKNKKDTALAKIKTFFAGDPGSSSSGTALPYKGCSIEKLGDLGDHLLK